MSNAIAGDCNPAENACEHSDEPTGRAREDVDTSARAQATISSALLHAFSLAAELRAQIEHSAEVAAEPPVEGCTYDIVIPAFNGAGVLATCLDSLLAHTDPRHLIHVIDDASTDPRVDSMLREYIRKWPQVRYYRLPVNVGFPGAVNAGLAVTRHDVVIVNSDTEFPPGWLGRMDRCRRSGPTVHAVSPLSNNATICSVPRINEKNALPPAMSVAQMDRLVSQTSLRRYPRAPTVVGFCMLITREIIDAVGPFDMAFGRGYGEEVDFCQRAWARGYECAICDDLYVFHHGEVGFSQVPEKKTLQEGNERKLAQRWPRYHGAVLIHCATNPLRCQQQRLIERLRRPEPAKTGVVADPGQIRVLHVLHAFDRLAGTEMFTRQLVDGTKQQVRSTILIPSDHVATKDALVEEEPGGLVKIRMSIGLFPLEHACRGAVFSLRSPNVERFFADVIVGTGAQVVHFSHLANLGSFALPLVARAVGARVVFVLHDYFLLCPDMNLVDADGRACQKPYADGTPTCVECMARRFSTRAGVAAADIGELLRKRAALARTALELADVVVAPSACVREHFRRAWGAAIADRIQVIAHGTPVRSFQPTYRPEPRLRVAFVGNVSHEKGWDTFVQAARLLRDKPIRFRILGGVLPGITIDPNDGLEIHGRYAPRELPQLLQDVDIAFIGSIWDEAYCYTLDEAYRAGTPVIATRIGALAERVEEGITGLLVAPGDASGLANAIVRLDDNRSLLAALRQGVAKLRLKSLDENLAEYAAIFGQLATSGAASGIVRNMMSANARVPVSPPLGLADWVASKGIALTLPLQPEQAAPEQAAQAAPEQAAPAKGRPGLDPGRAARKKKRR